MTTSSKRNTLKIVSAIVVAVAGAALVMSLAGHSDTRDRASEASPSCSVVQSPLFAGQQETNSFDIRYSAELCAGNECTELARLQGELSASGLQRTRGDDRFIELHLTVSEQSGEHVPSSEALATPVVVGYSTTGAVVAMEYGRQVDRPTARFLETLARDLQVVVPPTCWQTASRWSAVEQLVMADVMSHFTMEESPLGLQVEGRRSEVLIWHDEGGLVPLAGRSTKLARSKRTFQVSERSRIREVSGRDIFVLQEAGQTGRLELRTAIDLAMREPKSAQVVSVATTPRTTFSEPSDQSEYADEARIGAYSTESLLSELRRKEALPEVEGPSTSRLFVAATALFRRDAESAKEAAKLVLQGHEESRFLIAALGGAGTELAASLVAKILSQSDDIEQQQSALAALGRAKVVPTNVVDEMLGYFDHEELGGTARLMTGAVAFNTRDTVPDTSKVAAVALLEDLEQEDDVLVRADTLRALGNAGTIEAILGARESAGSADPIERAAAAQALRRVNSDVADRLLAILVEDTSSLVRRSALGAVLYRDPTEILLPVVERVTRLDGDATVRREAIRVLVRWKSESSAHETLVWVSKNDPQPSLRKVAAEGIARFAL